MTKTIIEIIKGEMPIGMKGSFNLAKVIAKGAEKKAKSKRQTGISFIFASLML